MIVLLVEIRSGEIVVSGVIEIVGPVIVVVHVVAVDVVRVDVVAIHIVDVHIVAIEVVLVVVANVVVVVVAIHECVGIGDVHVAVVNHGGIVPTASP